MKILFRKNKIQIELYKEITEPQFQLLHENKVFDWLYDGSTVDLTFDPTKTNETEVLDTFKTLIS